MTVRQIPSALIAFRFVAGPVQLLLAAAFGLHAALACNLLLAAGAGSDILDGVIARGFGCVMPGLRRWDARADLVFWAFNVAAALIMRPELRSLTLPMVGVLALVETAAPIVSLFRFGQDASTHHALSKVFGLALWLLVSVWFASGRAHPAVGDLPPWSRVAGGGRRDHVGATDLEGRCFRPVRRPASSSR